MGEPLLKLDRVSKRYGSIVIATDIDLVVGGNEALGIIGPNGAGKTTLFGIVTGTVTPDAGRVTYQGGDVTHKSPEERCRLGIARSFQIPQPFGHMTVYENLAVGAAFGQGKSERAIQSECLSILDRCGLIEKANRKAGALTLLDRKRLELARALATQPKLLLLDEVAGGLVEHECAQLVELIKEVRAGGIAVVWIEHVVHALIAVVDRLVVLHGGKFIAEGKPDEVIRSPAVQEIYMGIPAEA